VNVLIGANATGKTTLLKIMYGLCEGTKAKMTPLHLFSYFGKNVLQMKMKIGESINLLTHFYGKVKCVLANGTEVVADGGELIYGGEPTSSVFIPEYDLLSHSFSLPETVKHGNLNFNQCEVDIIEKARVVPDSPKQLLVEKIEKIISGVPFLDEKDGQSFKIQREGIADPIPFSLEASGFRKFALIALLVRNEQIKSGSVLFWDEPENSLNPELMPVLVEILLELQRNGVQIFIATHSYNLARWFDVKRDSEKGDEVTFYNLSKSDNGSIECVSATEYTKLPESILDIADEKLFKAVVADAMGVQEDE
jgi:AAA15 family ATPase/GTPase